MSITKKYIINLDSLTDLIREVNVTGGADNINSSTNKECFIISVETKQITCVSTYKITINDGADSIKIGKWIFLHNSIVCVNSKEKQFRIDITGSNVLDKQTYDFYCIDNYIENIEDLPYRIIKLIAEVGRCKSIKEFDSVNSNCCIVGRIKNIYE